MPLLKPESDVFPADLFVQAASVPWWVAHVRSRQEKALARYLRPLGVGFYLPQREHALRRQGRTRRSYLPLFPGYVFFRGGPAERIAALRSKLIVRVLDVPDPELLGEELGQLRQLQLSGAALEPCDPLPEGAAVRIVEGAFRGYFGRVVRGGDRPRLVVSVSILRKAVAVELDREAVVRLPSSVAGSADARSAVA
jgi:transcription termination/antitermination protein NusG